jgi:tetrahydromethanopterin S-methyltransferase subunit A
MTVKSVPFKHDTKGFFHIYVDRDAGRIVVEHYRNVVKDVGRKKLIVSGKANKKFTGTKADKLYREILAHNLVSKPDHAAYLGMELGKAETALNNNLDYEQDKKLDVR